MTIRIYTSAALGSIAAAMLLPAAPLMAQAQAKGVTRTELKTGIEAEFARLDKDSDGTITTEEITAAQQAMVAAANAKLEQKFAAEFKKLDSNGDGQLSLAEYTASAPEARAKDEASSQLEKFDSNKDGKLTLTEFRDPVLANFDKVDSNKDGKLSEAEQKKALAAVGR